MLEDTVEDALARIAMQFTPDPDEIETQVKDLVNLRNDVCHGFVCPARLGYASTDRILHILLVLAMLRTRSDQRDADPNPPGR